MVLVHFYIAVYILVMKPCESFLLAKNGLSKLKQLALITFLLLEYIYIYIHIYIYIYMYFQIYFHAIATFIAGICVKHIKNFPGVRCTSVL